MCERERERSRDSDECYWHIDALSHIRMLLAYIHAHTDTPQFNVQRVFLASTSYRENKRETKHHTKYLNVCTFVCIFSITFCLLGSSSFWLFYKHSKLIQLTSPHLTNFLFAANVNQFVNPFNISGPNILPV